MAKQAGKDPAFPLFNEDGRGGTYQYFGMSVRDWFAGQALASGLSSGASELEMRRFFGNNGDRRGGETPEQIMAARAYAIADAMIARRDKTGGDST